MRRNYLDEPYFNIARGHIKGVSICHKFGKNSSVGATMETVWSHGGSYTFPSEARTLSIASASENDDVGNTGATSISIEGLDANYNEIREKLNLDGTSSVTTSKSYLRVNRAYVGGNTNIGKITVSHNSLTAAVIDAGRGQTQMAVYTIPANKQGYIISFNGAASKSGATDLMLFRRDLNGAFRLLDELQLNINNMVSDKKVPLRLHEKTDLKVEATSASAGQTVTSNFDVVLVEEL